MKRKILTPPHGADGTNSADDTNTNAALAANGTKDTILETAPPFKKSTNVVPQASTTKEQWTNGADQKSTSHALLTNGININNNNNNNNNNGNNFGVIVHWGLYSVPAFDSVSSAKTRRIQNGSEWYLKRLSSSPSSFRPCSGWRETVAYHNDVFGPTYPYRNFATDFCKTATHSATESAMAEWMTLFKSIGANYVILTAKHHDGFCLYPTKTDDTYVPKGPDRVDWIGLFKSAALKAGLKFGVYYSWGEFRRPATKAYMQEIVQVQIDELIAYGPDLFWFDGDWMCSTNYAQETIDACVNKIKKALPKVEINDRIGHKQQRDADPNFLGLSTYRVYADRFIPSSKPSVLWEHVNTVGLSWGRNKQQKPADHKTAKELTDLRKRVNELGGRFLINVGPNVDASLCPIETSVLNDIAKTKL